MNKLLLVILIFCVFQGITAFCAKRCGEPWTRTCDACTTCQMSECDSCRNIDSCMCNAPSDPECDCLKSIMRFPEVEYPMAISDMKPYYCGCGRC